MLLVSDINRTLAVLKEIRPEPGTPQGKAALYIELFKRLRRGFL
jgi:hypothetical protein